MKTFTKEQLEDMYLVQKKTPSKIAEHFGCDHKTIRKYLRMYDIPLRSASEWNYLPRFTHVSPTQEALQTPVSLIGHALYLAEGWHTEKTTSLYFCNTDPLLLHAFINCVQKVYQCSRVKLTIQASTLESAQKLLKDFPGTVVYLDPLRKKPLVRVKIGGKVLSKEFIENARMLLSSKD